MKRFGMNILLGILLLSSVLLFSPSVSYAATVISVGNDSAAPVGNLRLNFTWTNSTVVGVYGTDYNTTRNITFNLPTGVTYILGSALTNMTAGLDNITLSSSSTVIFGNHTTNDSTDVSGWLAFNVSAVKSGVYTITVNETYNLNDSSTENYNNELIFGVVNGTITMTNATFANFTYTGNSLTMNFTGTPSSANGGTIRDNITYTVTVNGVLRATNYTCGATCSGGLGTISYANATADTYTMVFSTGGSVNYSTTSLTAVLKITQATPTLKIFINDVVSNQTTTYPASTTFKGNATLGNLTYVPSPTFNIYIVNMTTSSPAISLTSSGNPSSTSAIVGNATYQVVYNTSGNVNYTSASNSSLYLKVNLGTLIFSLSGGTVRYPQYVSVIATLASTIGYDDVNFSVWRDSTTLVASIVGNVPIVNSALLSVGTHTFILNNSAGKNWTANSTGMSFSVLVLEAGGGGGNGVIASSSTTTTILPSGGPIQQSVVEQVGETIEEIKTSEWWYENTLGVENWVLVASGIVIVVAVAVAWYMGWLEEVYAKLKEII